MKTLILLLMSCTVLFSLAGKEITITEGLWYISFPENSGEIKASEMAYRFNPDGSAEMNPAVCPANENGYENVHSSNFFQVRQV